MKSIEGGCTCGRIRFGATGEPLRVGVCHCLDCRRHHGAAFYAAAVFSEDAVRIEGQARGYRGRYFCPDCGASVYARSEGEIELHLGALDTPDRFAPEYELWTCQRESWLPPFAGTKGYARGREE